MQHLEHIYDQGLLIALIVRATFSQENITFLTPSEFSQQLGFMNHPKGKIIQAHIHNPVNREVLYTKEVLFIRKGILRVDFYTERCTYLESRLLHGGDIILLARGGHGFEVIESTEMIEVKQGPYAGEHDKTRFEGITAVQAIIGDDNAIGYPKKHTNQTA